MDYFSVSDSATDYYATVCTKNAKIYIFGTQLGPQHHLWIPLPVFSQLLFPFSYWQFLNYPFSQTFSILDPHSSFQQIAWWIRKLWPLGWISLILPPILNFLLSTLLSFLQSHGMLYDTLLCFWDSPVNSALSPNYIKPCFLYGPWTTPFPWLLTLRLILHIL